MTSFTVHNVQRDEGSLHVRDYAGAEPAFVLMHGFPDNSHIYDDLILHLVAGGRRVVAFDFLGFGESEKRAGATYNFKQQQADLLAVVDALGLDQIVPVAHDASGATAINFALDYPQRVQSLTVLNTIYGAAPTARLPELIELFATPSLTELSHSLIQSPEGIGLLLNFQFGKFQASLAEKHQAHSAEFLGSIIVGSFTQQPSSVNAFLGMTADLFAEVGRNSARMAEVQALDIPVTIIWGENDPYLNTGVAEDFHAHFKHSSLHRVSAGHWLMIDEPQTVAGIMLGNA
jgi:pimeloyl-ACP methyl ester carboxylesterase